MHSRWQVSRKNLTRWEIMMENIERGWPQTRKFPTARVDCGLFLSNCIDIQYQRIEMCNTMSR